MTWALIVLYAVSISADGYVSQQRGFVEQNPIAKPFSHSAKGQALGCSLGLVVGVAPSYILRKAHHRKLANAWLATFAGIEAANAADMGYLYANSH
jgi:hypothetical protein